MLDLKFVREHTDIIKADLEKRGDKEKLQWIEDILTIDEEYRTLLQQSQELRQKRNEVSEAINKAKKAGEDATAFLEEAKRIPKELEKIERDVEGKLETIQAKLMRLPNILHESVPVGKDEEENVVVEEVGEKPAFTFPIKDHEALMKKHNLADLEHAAKITGSRFYFLKNELAILEMALVRYGIDFMRKKGYEFVVPPFMMARKAYEGVIDFEEFEDVLYEVKDEGKYMISTSEHPLTAMHMNEVIEPVELPIKMTGLSTNFRKEAGTHGKEDKGIWRVHQFQKVEQVVLCKPEESWTIHEELLKNAKDFFDSLGLHYRVINICTGDIGTVAAKKYDLEAWIPSAEKYKEIVSCSNCTAYQATRLKIRMRKEEGNVPVHTLNCTCVATTRALVAIMEQFQQEDGSILIPEVLQKYCGFKKIGFA